MKKLWLFSLLVMVSLVGGCKQSNCDTGVSTCDDSKWRDPNYKIIGIGAYNYTEHDIYSVYILPTDKNDIDFAGQTSVGRGTAKDAKKWSGQGGSGANMAWDLRWNAPYKFKVWWLRMVDPKLANAPNSKYDIYTHRETEPGYAWCEYEIDIKETFGERYGVGQYPNMVRDELLLYFYPDGTVDAHLGIEFNGDVPIVERVAIAQRDQLPVLKDRACRKEVPNPLYGKPKPIPMY
jgi:hypothetical protein